MVQDESERPSVLLVAPSRVGYIETGQAGDALEDRQSDGHCIGLGVSAQIGFRRAIEL